MLKAVAREDQEYISGIIQFRIYANDICQFHGCNSTGKVVVEKGTTRVFLDRSDFDKKFKIGEEI